MPLLEVPNEFRFSHRIGDLFWTAKAHFPYSWLENLRAISPNWQPEIQLSPIFSSVLQMMGLDSVRRLFFIDRG